MKYAIISVHDKTGIVDFAKEIEELGFTIFSTGGTLKKFRDSGITTVKHISEITNFPEILKGRIKTDHPKIIGGILAQRDDEQQMQEIENLQIEPIDLVVCNLYPIEDVIKQGKDLKSVLENIDIGGPNMIRAAAKNFENVTVIVKPQRYHHILDELKRKGEISYKTKKSLAIEALKEIAKHDKTIYKFLEKI